MSPLLADDFRKAELDVLYWDQNENILFEIPQLQAGKAVSTSSRLATLAPEFDTNTQLMHVRGHFWKCEHLSQNAKHSIVLDPAHQITQFLIKHYDNQLHHSGPERVFPENRKHFWILET